MGRAHTDDLDVAAVVDRSDHLERGHRRAAGHAVPALLEGDGRAHGRPSWQAPPP